MRIVYIENLTVWSAIVLGISRKKCKYIFYFNASFLGKKMAALLVRLRCLNTPPQLAAFCVGEIFDDRGEGQPVRIQQDIMKLCIEISDKELKDNGFLKALGSEFNFKKMILFFEKIIAQEIHNTVVFVNVAWWHAGKLVGHSDRHIEFFLEKSLWSRFVSAYAATFGIKAVEYTTGIDLLPLTYLLKGFKTMISKFSIRMNVLKNSISQKRKSSKQLSLVKSRNEFHYLASWYTGRRITFDLKKRNEIFWLVKSGIPYEQVMLYVERNDVSVLQDDMDMAKEKGITFCFLAGSSSQSFAPLIWSPTGLFKNLRNKLAIKVIKNFFLQSAANRKIVPSFYLLQSLHFILQYVYWHDFFYSHNIKININPNTFSAQHVIQSIAIEKCGGVNVSYQISNFWVSTIASLACVDVLFSFGPSYQKILGTKHSLIDNFVHVGYATDYVIRETRDNALALRKDLLRKGVNFILCFFDENSSDNRMSGLPNTRSVRAYQYFLERVLEDETLGLVVKPGYPKTLARRLSPLAGLIKQVKETDRCIVMDGGHYLTDVCPAEAAQSADICIGLLSGGTAALEAYLAGSPTVFLDLERLYSHPLYQRGKGKVVFDNLDELFSTIQKFRTDPASIPGFGNLSSWVKDKDPFKDGNASLRIGQYLYWLLEMFNQGLTREEAIRYANQKYSQMWGLANIGTEGYVICPAEEKGEGYESMLNKRV